MIYLYNYVGQPWKAQWWTREVMDRLYSSKPDGYCGGRGQRTDLGVVSSRL